MDGRGDAGFPRNALTGRQYNGINPFMLMYDTIKHEYTNFYVFDCSSTF